VLSNIKNIGFMDSEIIDRGLLKTRKFAWVAIILGSIGIGSILINAAFNLSLAGAQSAMKTMGLPSAKASKVGVTEGSAGTVKPIPATTERPLATATQTAAPNKPDPKGSTPARSAEPPTNVPETSANFEKLVNEMLVTRPAEFRPGSSILSWNGKTNLDAILPILKAKPDWRFEIGAHIPPSDTPEADRLVTERRAEAIAGYLGSEGISNIRMSVRGYGSTKPIADNTSDLGRFKNQRIEIRILSTQ
jgi:outer membrane protein OmpA-like peptidoglycan-associated protein